MLHRSEPCMVVLSGLEAFCRHHRSISHKTENVTQVNKKQDTSTDISNVFTLSSSWVLTATGFCNKCVLQQYRFVDSFSSKGPFQRARGLLGLICLLACSSSCRAARKDFTLSLRKEREWVLMCLFSTQIMKLSPEEPWSSTSLPECVTNKQKNHSCRKAAEATNGKRTQTNLNSMLTM